MKRKSILMTIVAVLFTGVMAIGQTIVKPHTISWPANTSNAQTGVTVVASDTIYFCERTDAQYPIELGYDVSGRNLHPSFGDWSLISTTHDSVTVVDYDTTINIKNGGAGNAYKTVGTGKGGLLFQYLARDGQCGLTPNQAYWVYVFILPSEKDIVYRDTLICKAAAGSTATIKFGNTFKEYVDLYKNLGFSNPTWKKGGEYTVHTDTANIISFQDSLIFEPDTPSKAHRLTCGDTLVFKIVVTIKDSISLSGTGVGKCLDDTASLLKTTTLDKLFNREGINGTYSPATILNSDGTTTGFTTLADGSKKRAYTFTYKTCKTSPDTETIVDTLYLYEKTPTESTSNKSNWGKDTVIYCRLADDANIYNLYMDTAIDYPAVPGFKPGLDNTNSYWYDRDLGRTPFDFGPSGYGTISKTSSIGIPSTLSVAEGHYITYAPTNKVNVSDLKSSVGYHYLWRVDAGALPCYTISGVPDSGMIVLIIQDPAIAQDYTAQLCQTSFSSKTFDLNLYTRLNVKWTKDGSAKDLTEGHILDPSTGVYPGTYKYKYHLEPGCGAGGNGVFYIKVANQVKVSSKTVKYCVNKLPSSINMNDVLGVALGGVTWTATSDGSGFDTNSGILDIGAYVAAKGSPTNNTELVYTIADNAGCGIANGTKVTVSFVTNL
jgi:hypothetical protein